MPTRKRPISQKRQARREAKRCQCLGGPTHITITDASGEVVYEWTRPLTPQEADQAARDGKPR